MVVEVMVALSFIIKDYIFTEKKKRLLTSTRENMVKMEFGFSLSARTLMHSAYNQANSKRSQKSIHIKMRFEIMYNIEKISAVYVYNCQHMAT